MRPDPIHDLGFYTQRQVGEGARRGKGDRQEGANLFKIGGQSCSRGRTPCTHSHNRSPELSSNEQKKIKQQFQMYSQLFCEFYSKASHFNFEVERVERALQCIVGLLKGQVIFRGGIGWCKWGGGSGFLCVTTHRWG